MKSSRKAGGNNLLSKCARQPAHPAQPLRQPLRDLRGGEENLPANDSRETHSGLDPKQAIREWLQFAKASGYLRVAGHRAFRSDLDRVQIMEDEGKSLLAFAKSTGLIIPEKVFEIAQNSPTRRGGAEHRVFFDITSREGRVVKVTFPEKYGRW